MVKNVLGKVKRDMIIPETFESLVWIFASPQSAIQNIGKAYFCSV